MLTRVRRAVERCRAQGPLGLIWVPGHCGVPGNEEADGEATEGAVQSMRASLRAEATGDVVGGWNFLTPTKAKEIVAAVRNSRGDDASSAEQANGRDTQNIQWARWPEESDGQDGHDGPDGQDMDAGHDGSMGGDTMDIMGMMA